MDIFTREILVKYIKRNIESGHFHKEDTGKIGSGHFHKGDTDWQNMESEHFQKAETATLKSHKKEAVTLRRLMVFNPIH